MVYIFLIQNTKQNEIKYLFRYVYQENDQHKIQIVATLGEEVRGQARKGT